MTTFLCAVNAAAKKNYDIGVGLGLWGVIERYKHKIARASTGDRLLFIVGGVASSLHTIESACFNDPSWIWPPYEGDSHHGSRYPWRVRISRPIVSSVLQLSDLKDELDLTRGLKQWGGAIRGSNGVFNPLSPHDADLIEREMRAHPSVNLDEFLQDLGGTATE